MKTTMPRRSGRQPSTDVSPARATDSPPWGSNTCRPNLPGGGAWARLVLVGGLLVMGACSDEQAPATSAADAPSSAVDSTTMANSAPAAERGTWGVETRFMDTQTPPGTDFYRYVNAGWLDTATLPPGFASNGVFLELHLKTEGQVEEIITGAAAGFAPWSNPDHADSGATDNASAADFEANTANARIAAMYASYLDTDRIDALGLTPLKEGLDRLATMDRHDMAARIMAMPMHASIVGLGVMLDPGNADRHVLTTSQAGLGLPGREYYLRDDEPFPGHRAAYLDYIEGVFQRAGISDARTRAEDVLGFETALAEVHWTPQDRRDRLKNYHLMEIDALVEYAPDFPWSVFLEELGVGDATEIVVATDTAVAASAALFADTPLDVIRNYMTFHYLDRHAGLLSQPWVDARFDFYSRRLNGIEEDRPREKKAVQFVNGILGELVGEAYVAKHFPPEYEARMDELVSYLKAAFREQLEAVSWMDDTTRAAALAKLDAFTPKVGYPERWHNYDSLEIRPNDLVGNVVRFDEWAWADELEKLSEPRRDWEWGMTPQTVNAYYSPTRNEIVFPAAILQPPFFDPNADPAVNFAAIGGVIGHEMGHGFDDQGSRADANGELNNWWTDTARAQFEARAAELVAQYGAFEPIEGMHVNGELTLGENIGDLGGLSIAYRAWRNFAKDHYGEAGPPVIDGFTGDQRFFLSWAQVWRTLQTDDHARRQVLTDPHSPAQYRVNGVVRNMDAWYEAFDISEDDPLYLAPEERVRIW